MSAHSAGYVGAGITGLSAGIQLRTRGVSVAVLEQRFGAGATSRSGGIVLGDTLIGPSPDFNGCEQDLRRWISSGDVACDLVWTGCLALARTTRAASGALDWQDSGSVRAAAIRSDGVSSSRGPDSEKRSHVPDRDRRKRREANSIREGV